MSVLARPALCLVAALACTATAFVSIIPPAHAFDGGQDVVGAWYVQDGLIKVLAREAIDPSSVDPDKISLRISDGRQSTQVPLDGMVAVRDDIEERVVLVYLPPATWEEVSSSKRAFLTLEYGAFRHVPDGDAVFESVVRVAMPGQHIAELLVRAEYDAHTDRLSLNFADAVNVSRADWDSVYLRDGRGDTSGPAFRPFLGLEPVVVEGDGRTFVFGLDARGRAILLDMVKPTLYMGNGTDHRWIGIAAPGKSVWVWEARLASAEYLADENRLYLRFTDGVNPYSIYLSKMYFSDPTRFEEMRGLGFVGVSDDRRTVILDLPESSRYGLSVIASPQMTIEAGAVSTADGTDFGHNSVRLKVAAAADFFPPNPDIPAGVPVERATHREETGQLTLRFTEAIDPSSINASRITVSGDHPCLEMNLSGTELAGVAGDGRSAVFALDRHRNAVLSSMGGDQATFERGAFLVERGGAPNVAFGVPLSTIRASHNIQAFEFSTETGLTWMPCHLTYRVTPSLGELLAHYGYDHPRYQRMVLAAIHEGLDVWSRLNPHITFEQITDGIPNFQIILAYANSSKYGISSASLIQEGDSDSSPWFQVAPVPRYTDGTIKLRHPYAIMTSTAHEFGHNLGLPHHIDPNHLMYGDRRWLEDPFDERGLNIPERRWYESDPRWQGALVNNPPLDIPDHGWWWDYGG